MWNPSALNWFSLCLFNCKPRRLQSHVPSVQNVETVPPARCTSHTASQGLVSWRPPSWIPPFPFGDIEMMSTLLWIPWQHKSQNSNAPGHGCVSRHSVQSSFGQSLLVERSECKQLLQGTGCREIGPVSAWILLKLARNICLLWFPWYSWAPGSLLCESVTTFTCTKKCDCNVIVKMKKLITL